MKLDVISLYNPAIIPCKLVTIFDSTKVIDSPISNFSSVRSTYSTVVAFVWPTNTATAPLSAPLIFSPFIVTVSSDNPLTKTSLSKTGATKLVDSKIPATLKTSGVCKEISLSWTLNP